MKQKCTGIDGINPITSQARIESKIRAFKHLIDFSSFFFFSLFSRTCGSIRVLRPYLMLTYLEYLTRTSTEGIKMIWAIVLAAVHAKRDFTVHTSKVPASGIPLNYQVTAGTYLELQLFVIFVKSRNLRVLSFYEFLTSLIWMTFKTFQASLLVACRAIDR